MPNGLHRFLGQTYLMGLVEDVKTGIPKVLPDKFWTLKSATKGDAGEYTRYAGTRQTLQRVEYGAPPVRTKLEAIGTFQVKLAHFSAEIQLKPQDYMSLRRYDSREFMNKGKDEVDRQATLFLQKRDNTKVALVHSMLALGYIYFDAAGNLLPTSSGAALTIDYGIGANNRNQLNSVLSASWATDSTNIPKDIEALQIRSLQQTGREIKTAVYGASLPGYLAKNTYTKTWLERNPTMNAQWLNGSNVIPNGLFGLDWVPGGRSFFVDQDGSTQTWFPADQVTFIPELDSELYELMEGTIDVPTSTQVFEDISSVWNSFAERLGDFMYALPVMKPVTAELVAGWTGLPVWKVPDAMYIADTTF
jgi:hypothetical protein